MVAEIRAKCNDLIPPHAESCQTAVQRPDFPCYLTDYASFNDWDCGPHNGKQLPCQSQQGNAQDAFTVAVLKDRVIIGNILQKISAACSMFLHREIGFAHFLLPLNLHLVLRLPRPNTALLHG